LFSMGVLWVSNPKQPYYNRQHYGVFSTHPLVC
jgi:hypothetical protein